MTTGVVEEDDVPEDAPIEVAYFVFAAAVFIFTLVYTSYNYFVCGVYKSTGV